LPLAPEEYAHEAIKVIAIQEKRAREGPSFW